MFGVRAWIGSFTREASTTPQMIERSAPALQVIFPYWRKLLAEKTAWNVWEDPDKMTNLCCGLAGRAYGLLNLYKHTGEKAWLHRAQELANRAAVGITASTLHENSLYKEQVGVAVLAADLSRP